MFGINSTVCFVFTFPIMLQWVVYSVLVLGQLIKCETNLRKKMRLSCQGRTIRNASV